MGVNNDDDLLPPDVSRIEEILVGADRVVRRDDRSPTLEAAARAAPVNTAVIVTSKAALRDYDPAHPERIVCIVVNDGMYNVVVNNREFQGAAQLLRAMSAPHLIAAEAQCVICLDGPNDKGRKLKDKTMSFARCPHCLAVTCVECLGRMLKKTPSAHSSRFLDDTARACPMCRRWVLNGDAFGTPLGPSGSLTLRSSASSLAADTLVDDVVARLDGAVEVVMRVGTLFVIQSSPLTVTRLTDTDRYSDGCPTRLRHVRKTLKDFFTRVFSSPRPQQPVHVYVYRRTWRIDPVSERPVVEASAFRVLGVRGPVLQLRRDAWIQALRPDDAFACHVRVEHVSPAADFPVPPHVEAALDEIAIVVVGGATCTLSVEFDDGLTPDGGYSGFNLDCMVTPDGRLEPKTMHRHMMEASLDMHISSRRRSVLSVCVGRTLLLRYHFNNVSCERI